MPNLGFELTNCLILSHICYLGLGTNLGDRVANLRRAAMLLQDVAEIKAVSSLYESAPWGVTDQPAFINLCLSAETSLSPDDLLSAVKKIEQQMGREKSIRWGPRLIDIDILLYDDLSLCKDDLQIPHPFLAERTFVIKPLAEIAPERLHPVEKQTLLTLANGINVDDLEQLTIDLMPLDEGRRLPFKWGERSAVMGIINATPDSFSGDGLGADDIVARAVAQAVQFVDNGADILDIGGESTRPSAAPIDGATEQARVLPVIRAIRSVLPDTIISIDTYRPETAQLCLEAGADWINDVWGLMQPEKKGVEMGQRAAKADCPIILMHNGRNRERQERDDWEGGYYGYYHYDDLLAEVKAELLESVQVALDAGVSAENIILDPGIGFGKNGAQNLELINRLDEIRALGYPVLLGSSRKGFIGHVLGGLPASERVEGTAATIAIGIDRGADIVRVHDVKEMARVARIADAIKHHATNGVRKC